MRLSIAIYLALWILAIFGWGSNIYKLTDCDFEAPYKAEVIRIIGIPVAPMGAIMGYFDIKDEKPK